MSGSLTTAQKEWMAKVLHVAADVAGPKISGAVKDAVVAGMARPKTATISTPFGDFVYLATAAGKVQSALTTIVDDYKSMSDYDETLQIKTSRLQELDEKYREFDAADLHSEIAGKTDRTLKDEAGAARGAQVVDEGFKVYLNDLLSRLKAAKQNVTITSKDLEIEQTQAQSAAFAKMGKELQEGPGKAILAAVTTAVGLVDDARSLMETPTSPKAWVDAVNDVFNLFSSETNPFLEKAAELQRMAEEMKLPNLVAKVGLARTTMAEARDRLKQFEPVIRKSGRDLVTKLDTRDSYFDAKKGGKLRFNEVKEGADLAKLVHDAAYQAGGLAEKVKRGIRKLLATAGDPARWMADPAAGNRIIKSMSEQAEDVSRNAIPLVGYATKLQAAFTQLYTAAGEAMADAPGTGG